jgi:hypothetical protein
MSDWIFEAGEITVTAQRPMSDWEIQRIMDQLYGDGGSAPFGGEVTEIGGKIASMLTF